MWILLLVLLAPFTPTIDLYCSTLFYSSETGFYNNFLFYCLYEYGELFGLATGGIASVILGISFIYPKWKKWRAGAASMVLTLVIGAGLVTNMGFKEYWGRPRPKQVIEFGGKHAYRPFWKPDFHTGRDPQRSFPSGHVSMGFYLISLWMVGKRYQSSLLKNIGLTLTIFLGGGLMIVRVAQGGHFFSDVIASPILMWYIAKGVDWWIFTSEGWGAQLLGLNTRGISQGLDANGRA